MSLGNTKFTYASLFSGVGGFEQALNKRGGQCVFASEIDKFAREAYGTLYGNEVLHGDITKINADDIPDHDVLTAGFPCQSFSVAGKRKGFQDTRGTLFFDVARVLDRKQPRVVLLENVKGLVNHDDGRTLDVIVRTLNDVGYVVDFDVLNSKFFGVPQNRERVFIVGVRKDLCGVEGFYWERLGGSTILPVARQRMHSWAEVFNFDWPLGQGTVVRLQDVLQEVVDGKYYIDNKRTRELVKHLKKGDGGRLYQRPRGSNPGGVLDGAPTLTSSGWEHNNFLIEPRMVGLLSGRGHESNRRVYDAEGVSPTVLTSGGGGHEVKVLEVRPVLTPERIEKRQNGRLFKEVDEPSFTITTQDRHGVAIKGEGDGYRVRKLTPLECFRLQGFPDKVFHTLTEAGISDRQLYKMAGNAVTVNVVDAIFRNVLEMEGVL